MASASVRIRVTGMHCDHCSAKVTKSLTGVAGFWGADVSVEEGWVDVDFDDTKTSAATLADAVTRAGYDAKVTP